MNEPNQNQQETTKDDSENSQENPLIINEPESLRLPHKITSFGLTLLFWGLLLYLWQPLISMLAWSLNVKLFYNHMIVLGGYHNFIGLLIDYLIIIIIIGCVLILWARINQWRFRGNERRTRPPDAYTEELAEYFEVSQLDLEKWQKLDSLEISLNDDDLPERVEVHIPEPNSTDEKNP